MKPFSTAYVYAAFLFLLILCTPALAHAGVWDKILPSSLDDLLRKAIGGGVVFLIVQAGKLLGIKNATAKVQKYVDVHALTQRLADAAIGYAEELAHKAKKAKSEFTSQMKENAAIQRGLEELKKAGISPGKILKDAEEELKKVILSRLGSLRASVSK